MNAALKQAGISAAMFAAVYAFCMQGHPQFFSWTCIAEAFGALGFYHTGLAQSPGGSPVAALLKFVRAADREYAARAAANSSEASMLGRGGVCGARERTKVSE